MTTAPVDDHELICSAQHVADLVVVHADALAQSDQLPDEIVEASLASGLYRLCLPSELGGLSVALPEAVSVIAQLSYLDGSVGWCTVVANVSASLLTGIDEKEARFIAAEPDRLCIAGGFAPLGRGRRAGGSYELSGRWSFASGCTAATWMLGGMMAETADGEPPTHLVGFFPAADAEIILNWDVIGLRATGSHDVAVNALMVPDERTTPLVGGQRWSNDPVAAVPFFANAPMLAAVPLGIAQRALDELVDLASTKTPLGQQQPLVQDPVFQHQFAAASNRVNAARDHLIAEAQRVWDAALTGFVTPVDQAGATLAAGEAADAALEAVQFAHRAAGTSSIRAGSTLTRCLNDTMVATRHAAFGLARRGAAHVVLGLRAA